MFGSCRLIDLSVHPDDDVWALGIMLFEIFAQSRLSVRTPRSYKQS